MITYTFAPNQIYIWPTLFHKNYKGFLYQWSIEARNGEITVRYGRENGKIQVTTIKATAKNVGKANETTPEEQAFIEASAMYAHKLKRKYSETIKDAEKPSKMPMLAQKYKKNINFKTPNNGWMIQPKIDGVRCVAECIERGNVVLLSRSGEEWETLSHIKVVLETEMIPGEVFDGEIYLHGLTFQEITRLVKKEKPDTKKLRYCIFDAPSVYDNNSKQMMTEKSSFIERSKVLLSHPIFRSSIIGHVNSFDVSSQSEVDYFFDKFITEGYEGGILRKQNSPYEYGRRSPNLLKIKSMDDDEFLVIDVKEGKGNFTGCAILVCQTLKGATFNVTPKCSHEMKQKIWDARSNYLGRFLKVKYQGLTEDGIPRFPVGLGTRDTKDMS